MTENRGPLEPLLRAPERPGVPYLVLVLAGVAVFAQTIGFGPSNHDDTALILNNQPFLLDPANALGVFTRDAFSATSPTSGGIYYRPMLWLSWMLDARIGGTDLRVYHITSVAYHVLACALFFRLLTGLRPESRKSQVPPLFFALVLLLHPTIAHATAWLPGRNDTLLGIFVLATVLSLLRFFAQGGAVPFAASLIFWNATLYTKEGGLFVAALVPCLLAPHWFRDRKLPTGTILLGAFWIATGVIWFLLRRSALGGFPLFFAQIPKNLEAIVIYVGKTLIPLQLSVAPSVADGSLIPGVIVTIVLIALIFHSRRQRPEIIALSTIWFVAGLSPALLAPEITRGLEHRLYVPMMGLLIGLAEVPLSSATSAARRSLPFAAIAVLIGLAAMTLARFPDYVNQRAYWDSAFATSPSSPEVIAALCRVEFREEQWEAAVARCDDALAMQRRSSALHCLRGIALQKLERWNEAEKELKTAMLLPHAPGPTLLHLAQVLEAQGRTKDAQAVRRRILHSRP